MTQIAESEEPLVVPLRQRGEDGSPYHRRAEVERTISALMRIPGREVVERCRVSDPNDPDYVPSECVLYFVRRPSRQVDELDHRDLFVILRQRVLGAVPVFARRADGSESRGERATDLDVRDAVLHNFQKLLCEDRRSYRGRLDFYECQFNSAMAKLRATARKSVGRRAARVRPLDGQDDVGRTTADVEQALAAIRNPDAGVDFLYRSKLHVAISSLPPDERRVVELLLQEIPIESSDESVQSIVETLKCSEKTVRNRRDRAYTKLRAALKEEES